MTATPGADLFGMIVTWLLVLAMVVFCLLWFIDPILRTWWRWRNPPGKIAADQKGLEERLLHPDWTFYERHLQRPVPPALRELFADRELILARDLDCGESEIVAAFSPLDERALIGPRPVPGLEIIAIATNVFGDPIYLRPGPAEADAIYVTYHDGGETEQLAPDVTAFVQRLRHAGPND